MINHSYAQRFDENYFVLIPEGNLKLTQKGASHFASLALKCIQQEFPNKLGHVMDNADDWQNPKVLHPAFYGCYDWHSAVHGHWMLIRLLKLFPDLPEVAQIRQAIGQNLLRENIGAETAYFERPSATSYERTYGWAWLLKLAEELYAWEDAEAKQWAQNLQPLTDLIVQRYLEFLPRQTYPIRTGVHPNTAFGLSFALDYAITVNHETLKNLIIQKSLEYYKNDTDCPAHWEPGGADFFSPCLLEADLMRKVFSPQDYVVWLNGFLGELESGKPKTLLDPAIVSDRSDMQIVHLDGLNLSRAWCMLGIIKALPNNSALRKVLLASVQRHVRVTLPNIANGNYAGEHWLASFAVCVLSYQ